MRLFIGGGGLKHHTALAVGWTDCITCGPLHGADESMAAHAVVSTWMTSDRPSARRRPPDITGAYGGEFGEMKRSWNTLLDVIAEARGRAMPSMPRSEGTHRRRG
jgi:hypothetical protein